ncbi:MAG: response regulator transcription factor [Candidatus Binatia bacterium]
MHSNATVFVVDDDPAMRESLRWLIESVGLNVETFPTAQEFLESYDPSTPGCLVLDIRMPGMSGLDLQSELAARKIPVPILIITGHAEVPVAVRALKAGALDFIQKPFSDQLLLDRIRRAIEADVLSRRAWSERAEVAARVGQLTPREREVMDLVIAGKANKVIASELGLSPKTVEVHRAHVMKKMQVDSLADLVRLGILARGENPRE